MNRAITLEELVDKFERQEQHVMQLVKIVASTNKRISDLTISLEAMKKETVS